MVTRRQAGAAIALAVVWGLTMSGCTPQPAPVPSASATGFASDEEAFAAAEATYRAYVDALNRVSFSDPATFESVYDWTADPLEQADRTSFEASHEAALSITGSFRVVNTSGYERKPITGEVVMDSCLDVSDISISNSAGVPQTSADRSSVVPLRITLMPTLATDTGLLLTDSQPRADGLPC